MTALSVPPQGLLLDFGGVLVKTSKIDGGVDHLTDWMVDLATARGIPADRAEVHSSLETGLAKLSAWKDSSSALTEPAELDPLSIVRDFLAHALPDQVAEFYASEADMVLAAMNLCVTAYTVRPGVRRLLAIAHAAGIPTAIVSNAHSGASHRQVLDHLGLSGFVAQFYSDEMEIRKPHPDMIHLAARAVGVTTEACWYVGDTLDRDVQAGRRAGVGAVLVTESQHTDTPPFEVGEEPDARFPDPSPLADLLAELTGLDPEVPTGPDTYRGSGPSIGRPVVPAASWTGGALLIDHGGVISSSTKNHDALAKFAAEVGRELGIDPNEFLAAVVDQKAARSEEKVAADRGFTGSGSLAEMDRLEFWGTQVGARFDEATRARLASMAKDLSARYGRAKSTKQPRSGIRTALEAAVRCGMRVVVVSNTVSGRVVRETIASHGLDDLITAYVCSDEYRVRKPDPSLAKAALTIAGAKPGLSWFLGDKPRNDAWGAQLAGIARRVVVRGGSTTTETIDTWDGDAITDVIDEPGDLANLINTPTKVKECS